MNWEIAAKKSKRGVAERFVTEGDMKYKVHRWLDGHTVAYTAKSPTRTVFYVPEGWSEGYEDWRPASI